ncbi:MAG: stage III sporulation protein AG [Oscillospiraceae bacterium]|jgi:stage III sporulation protein AG|nr:stage III sporulation protein AG [Oscillospiraceae bacterium]
MSKGSFSASAQKIVDALKKYKYAALVVLLGLALLLIPFGGNDEPTASTPEPQETLADSDALYAQEMEQRLTQMLLQVNGAGRVNVMLTLYSGSRTQYQTDTQISTDTGENTTSSNEERKTVILSEGSAYDKAAVSATVYPQFLGALVVSEGADNAEVRLNLISAVSSLTGLSADKITVVKMK